MTPSRLAAAAGALLFASLASPSIADVISDWNTAVVPPAPELKEVTVDPATTAVLFLDMMKAGCSARPRCVAAVPNIKRMHDMARAHNMVVWYSLVGIQPSSRVRANGIARVAPTNSQGPHCSPFCVRPASRP